MKQLLLIGLTTFLVFVGVSKGLKRITNHNEYQKVPNLKGIPLEALPAILVEQNLRFEIIDSTKFVPSLPPLSVIAHLPIADSEVKKNRKIYLTLNPSGYR
ncbi:MAG: PASTA domain-containing protein, partial [Flavobacteriaceae bacterium]